MSDSTVAPPPEASFSRLVSFGLSSQLRSAYVLTGNPQYSISQHDTLSRSRLLTSQLQRSRVKQHDLLSSSTLSLHTLATGVDSTFSSFASTSDSSFSSDSTSGRALTFSAFMADLPAKFRTDPETSRCFSSFLLALQSWLGMEEAPPAALANVAYEVYTRLSRLAKFAPPSAYTLAQAEVEEMFGVSSTSTKGGKGASTRLFKEVLALVRQLNALKQALMPLTTTILTSTEDNMISDTSLQRSMTMSTSTSKALPNTAISTTTALSPLDLLTTAKSNTNMDSVSGPMSVAGSFGSSWRLPTISRTSISTERDNISSVPVFSNLATPSFFIDVKISGGDTYSSSTQPISLNGAMATTLPKYDYAWLHKKCAPLAQYADDGTELLSEDTVAESIIRLVKSSASDDAIQGELVDLVGFEQLDLVSDVIAHRSELKMVDITRERKEMVKAAREHATATRKAATLGLSSRRLKSHGVGINVTSQEQIEESKKARRLARRLLRLTVGTNSTTSSASTSTSAQLQSASRLRQQTQSELLELQNILGLAGGTTTSLSGAPLRLPEGASRTKHKLGWEEVFVPPPVNLDNERLASQAALLDPFSSAPTPLDGSDPVQLVPITAFAESVRPALRGIKSLNALQSRVFECAYNSSCNMLVCAPTGAGKTNVALTTVLREVTRCTVDGVIRKNDFKIVYVAPMKALAQEVAAKFSERLAPLGLLVRELTGDMQLTKAEIAETQLIVTTPEKWDVVTRKAGDGSLIEVVRLLILDEVHLLHEDRGPVIEVLVARTHRYVETSQRAVRVVGLSATLPNPRDVGSFLGVPPSGLFVFGPEYRPVPLEQTYIGISETAQAKRLLKMNECAYEKTVESLRQGHQVMVFVHSRKETVKLAQYFATQAGERGDQALFQTRDCPGYDKAMKDLGRVSRSSESANLFRDGLAVHHAGLARPERSFVESHYSKGLISVLVCTATLAWGVNLPAHTVIIKGTQLYDPSAGGWTDVGMLDVMQIFGRAGRPQFDTSGEAFLITSQDKLPHYLSMLTAQMPIESQMINSLPDHINAEVILGTISSLREAEVWLTYTYLYARMLRNPTLYGVSLEDAAGDPSLHTRRTDLVRGALKELMACRMVKFDGRSGNIYPTDAGRVAALYYIDRRSMGTFHERMRANLREAEALDLIARSREFSQIKLRQEEIPELEKLRKKICPLPITEALVDGTTAKANILIQVYISRGIVTGSSLGSDLYFVQQSAGRIARALFELSLRQGNALLAGRFLGLCKALERRVWPHQHPLRQFPQLKPAILAPLEAKDVWLDRLSTLNSDEITRFCEGSIKDGKNILNALWQVPWLRVRPVAQPLTRDVLRITLHIAPDFRWNPAVHSGAESFYFWIEDAENTAIYQHELWTLTRDMARESERAASQNQSDEPSEGEEFRLVFTIPIFEPIPPQYIVRVVSDRWLGSEAAVPVDLRSLALPSSAPIHSPLLPLAPLPVTALANPIAETYFRRRFTHFNPVQTQVFHAMYHSDTSALVGAPTGSGKTVIAELAILRALYTTPGRKIVYVAPMKALARERVEDWGGTSPTSMASMLNLSVVELTGDTAPSARELAGADILVTTPEKWDGVSREWRSRGFVSATSLLIIDEIHLLGQDRGPVLEVIVSRMRCVAASTSEPVRVLGLSTALSNARDLGDWLGVEPLGLFNFPPAVRPVPLSIYVSGYPGKHYCPRMALMNKPVFAAITTHSPDKPTLVFVSSRRQTRLTGLDLVALATAAGTPKRWVRLPEDELEGFIMRVSDPALQHLLGFGIGMHHAGLSPGDRAVVEELFLNRKILVLICTATLAWGVNFPAHLVVVKGTEFFDAKLGRYVDFPITDVLQMIGRAGRPQFDSSAKACILVHEPKKPFYHKFLHSPFPVESSLHEQLHDHVSAEIAGGAIAALPDALDWLSWTFFYRRLLMNPTYYGLGDTSPGAVNAFMINLLARIFTDLEQASCIRIAYDQETIITATKDGDKATVDEEGYDVSDGNAVGGDSILAEMDPSSRARAFEIAKLLQIHAKKVEKERDRVTSKQDKHASNAGSFQLSREQERLLADLDRKLSMLVQPTSLGAIAAFYYVSHKTIKTFCALLRPDVTAQELFWAVCAAEEFANLPVRHNEDKHNLAMLPSLEWNLDPSLAASPHGKTSILLQARWQRLPLPVSDYATDLKLVLDQSARLLLALVDVCADAGWLNATLSSVGLVQAVVQGRWAWDSPFANLPSSSSYRVTAVLKQLEVQFLPQLLECDPDILIDLLTQPAGTTQGKMGKKKNATSRHGQVHTTVPLSRQKAIEFVAKVSLLPRVNVALHGPVSTQEDYDENGSATTKYALKATEFSTHRPNRSRVSFVPLTSTPSSTSSSRTSSLPVFKVRANAVADISFGMVRLNGWVAKPLSSLRGEDPMRVIGPSDVKSKKEGWWAAIGRLDSDELLALARVNVGVLPRNSSLRLNVPDAPYTRIKCTFFLLSDCYLGLDQQYDFILDIVGYDFEEDDMQEMGIDTDHHLSYGDETLHNESSFDKQKQFSTLGANDDPLYQTNVDERENDDDDIKQEI